MMADKENSFIKFRVTEEEKKQIADNAKACGKSLSAYLREVALNMVIINIDHSVVLKHSDIISDYLNVINQLLIKANNDGQLTSEDVGDALENLNDILRTEKAFLREFSDQFTAVNKSVSKAVCNEVKKQLLCADFK